MTWTVGDLAAGQSGVITISFRVNDNVPDNIQILNVATLTWIGGTIDSAGNIDTTNATPGSIDSNSVTISTGARTTPAPQTGAGTIAIIASLVVGAVVAVVYVLSKRGIINLFGK